MRHDAIVAIPCYNCAPQLKRVLDAIDEATWSVVSEVWVIDNGSSDSTREVAVAASRRDPRVRAFRNEENVNLGGTHKAAFIHAQEAGVGTVVIVHGDDQADIREVPRLLEQSRADGCTVLGSRFSPQSELEGYDRRRVWGNKVLNALYSALALRRLSDLGSGLNVFRLADIDLPVVLTFGNTLSFNYELLLHLVRRRSPFRYAPIRWRESDQVTNARNVRIFTAAVAIALRWRFGIRPRTVPPRAYRWVELSGIGAES
jgi:dolichol-phosphate mannosyltransferase